MSLERIGKVVDRAKELLMSGSMGQVFSRVTGQFGSDNLLIYFLHKISARSSGDNHIILQYGLIKHIDKVGKMLVLKVYVHLNI